MIGFRKNSKRLLAVLVMLAMLSGEYDTAKTAVYAAEPEMLEANNETTDPISKTEDYDSEYTELGDNDALLEDEDESDSDTGEYDGSMIDIPAIGVVDDSEDQTGAVVVDDTEELMDSDTEEPEDVESVEQERTVDSQDGLEQNGDTELPELRDYLSLEDPSDEYYYGTKNNPYLIGSLADLKRVREFYDDADHQKYQ